MLKQGKCKHFTGIRDAQCAAGVNYVLATKNFELSLPCMPQTQHDKREPSMCESFCEPTADEIAKDRAELDAHMDKMRLVMEGIAPLRKEHKGKGYAGIIECPACKGKLHLSISSYNGHAHGRCETSGCVNWME